MTSFYTYFFPWTILTFIISVLQASFNILFHPFLRILDMHLHLLTLLYAHRYLCSSQNSFDGCLNNFNRFTITAPLAYQGLLLLMYFIKEAVKLT